MDKAYFCSMLKDNIYRKKRLIRSLLGVAALVATLYSCASMGRPDGGPFDETPPRFIGSTPAAGAVNTKKSKIVLDFDEFIKLEKASEKVVVSPPQLQQPEIKPGGKRITVNLLDSLKPNTTYTIDFRMRSSITTRAIRSVILRLHSLQGPLLIQWRYRAPCLKLLIWNPLKVCWWDYIPT